MKKVVDLELKLGEMRRELTGLTVEIPALESRVNSMHMRLDTLPALIRNVEIELNTVRKQEAFTKEKESKRNRKGSIQREIRKLQKELEQL